VTTFVTTTLTTTLGERRCDHISLPRATTLTTLDYTSPTTLGERLRLNMAPRPIGLRDRNAVQMLTYVESLRVADLDKALEARGVVLEKKSAKAVKKLALLVSLKQPANPSTSQALLFRDLLRSTPERAGESPWICPTCQKPAVGSQTVACQCTLEPNCNRCSSPIPGGGACQLCCAACSSLLASGSCANASCTVFTTPTPVCKTCRGKTEPDGSCLACTALVGQSCPVCSAALPPDGVCISCSTLICPKCKAPLPLNGVCIPCRVPPPQSFECSTCQMQCTLTQKFCSACGQNPFPSSHPQMQDGL
jgi:hypothetical protein